MCRVARLPARFVLAQRVARRLPGCPCCLVAASPAPISFHDGRHLAPAIVALSPSSTDLCASQMAKGSESSSSRRRITQKRSSATKTRGISDAITKEQHRRNCLRILDAVEASFDLSNKVWYMIETKKLIDSDEASQDRLPNCVNKFRLLKIPLKERILRRLCPRLFGNPEMVKQLKKGDNQIITKSLKLALNVDLNCALFSKHIETLIHKCDERYKEQGQLLDELVMDANKKLEYPLGKGLYKLVGADSSDGRCYTHVEHWSGKRAELSQLGCPVDDTWTISHNFIANLARIRKGKFSERVVTLFSNQDRQYIAPLKLERAPAANSATSSAGSRTLKARDSDASAGSHDSDRSACVAKPPAGNGGATG